MNREKMIEWLVKNVQIWPYVTSGAAPVPSLVHPWVWQFDMVCGEQVFVVADSSLDCETITMSDWNNAVVGRAGLPPVGKKYEYHTANKQWHTCIVVGETVDNHHVLHDLTDDSLHFITNVEDWEFRAIVDKRAAAVNKMMNELPVHNRDQHLCELLYDAGYRHVEQ